MQSLAPIRPRFGRCLPTFRAFSSSSSSSEFRSSDYSNQSRGGLPRFFSERLPSSKGGLVRVQDDEFWHMAEVLRLRANNRKLGYFIFYAVIVDLVVVWINVCKGRAV
ncbi:uncharacterized protein LOC112170617 isoform X2 [Rosa chinensis]|uniref:uncharacterized protein LOC112170617 isoform X2 n=1 Tax=Rosa chinensis TaxID=74649 RepID=UPI000D08C6E1|nr:uncharacterized protein LOC112170617 isoform X2 [Rosa chinensis]